jgi:LacI family transcriptional regulator
VPPKNSALPKQVTVHDVARAAGVAIATVSRVVNGVPTVAEEVRGRVQSAIDELGWSPSTAARAMRGIPSRMVCVIISDIRNPIYPSMIKGAEDVLSEHDYMLVVASSDGSSARELALLNMFKRRGADGVIFSVHDESNPEVLASVASRAMPVVLMERELAAPVNAVGADHVQGVRKACEYLIGMGHRRIALITGGRGNRVARDRLLGLQQAHDHAGIPLDPGLLKLDSFSTDYAFRETQMLLGSTEPPTAIMALGMQLLPGVLPAVRMRGLVVPDEISLIASSDSPLAELATPAITVLRYDAYTLGAEAGRLLLRQLRGELQPQGLRISIPTELVLRNSCAPVKGSSRVA